VSLTEIEKAVKELSREDPAKLAGFIAQQDKLVWDEELEQDFSPGGKHAAVLEKIDAEIDAGNFRPMPLSPMRLLPSGAVMTSCRSMGNDSRGRTSRCSRRIRVIRR
jgi:hypothetical protein